MSQYIVGHRGALGLAPENTLKAFHIGCQGADVIECDVHLSKDAQLVVIHDNTLDRTTNGIGWVRNQSLAELQHLDAGDGERIPILAEVVDVAKKYNKKLTIEVKGESWPIVHETTLVLSKFLSQNEEIHEQVSVHSFWHGAVKAIKENYPHILTAVVMQLGLQPREMLQFILNAKADGASVAYDYISEDLLSLAHARNLFLDAWRLNNTATFNKMKHLGVNGLITDFPGTFAI